MDYFILLAMGFIVGLSGAMIPGPMSAFVISSTLQGRARGVALIVLGHIFIEAVMVVLILLGLRHFIGSKTVFNILSILGGAALIIMGLLMVFKFKQTRLPKDLKVNFFSDLVAGGIFFTAFNPTFPAWWASVGASLLSKALLSGIIGVIMLTLGHWLADFAWFGSMSFVVYRGRPLLGDKMYQAALRILGIMLVGLGFWFIFAVNKITN